MEVAIRQVEMMTGMFNYMEREAMHTAEVMEAVHAALHMERQEQEE